MGWRREKLGGVIEWRKEKLGQKKKEKLPKNELWQHPNETKGVQININNMQIHETLFINGIDHKILFFNGLVG